MIPQILILIIRQVTPPHLGTISLNIFISFGLQDGSNEQNDYINQYYNPVNPALSCNTSGKP